MESSTKGIGANFAPLNVPLERRLQTAAVLKWTMCFLFLGFGCLFLNIGLLFTRFYYIPLLYAAWYMFDRQTPSQGGRPCAWVRGWKLWKYMRDYFPITLVKTADLDPSKNYILGYHPHGVMSAGAFCNFATDANGFGAKYPGIRPILLTLSGQFQFPFHREYIMTTGVCDCSKESIGWLLTKQGSGNALVLVVGGAVEALDAIPEKYSLNLSHRKGFIKLALRNGASLVPVFSFGENDLFLQAPNPEGSTLRTIQNKMTKVLGFSAPVFHGRGVFNYAFGLIPFRKPVHTIVGQPITVNKVENPTQQQIDDLHKTYVEALKDLFETHKSKYGVDDMKHLDIH